MIAIVFPGQGSQQAGMGADVARGSAAARAVFAEADAVLADAGLPAPLSTLCWAGPEEALRPTEIAQPALLTASYALYRAACEVRDLAPAFVAGHSLGEYTALVAAGALDFATALRLVRRRGELMRDAALAHPGAMAAILALSDEQVAALCAQAEGVAVAANLNAPGQVVISGEAAAVEAVSAAAKAAGGRAIALKVSGPFHSPLMASAGQALAAELDAAEFRPAQPPVVQNVSARPASAPADLRAGLAAQVTGSVRWHESVQTMLTLGVSALVECGPGNVLTGLARRALPQVPTYNVNTAETLAGLADFAR